MPIADSPLRDRVVFLVGARRSGTNWLERILTAHPAIASVPTETYLFSAGIKPLADCFQHANPNAPSMARTFVPHEVFVDSVRDLVDRVLMETLRRKDPDARYIVERTPWHASHIPLIASVYPDAHIMHIVRDGRAVARSLVSMPWGPDRIEEAAEEWRRTVSDARRGGAALGDRYLEVVYETLVQNPRRETAALFDWLDLDLSDALWTHVLAEAGSEFNVDPGSPGVRTDKWREELAPRDIRAVERIAGRELVEFGYSLDLSNSARRSVREFLGGRKRLNSAAQVLRRPRVTVRAARRRAFARRLHEDQVAHNNVVSQFERLVAEGNDSSARELLSPRLWARIADSGRVEEKRGPEAADALLRALREHQSQTATVMDGHVHASPYGLTTVATYELADGSLWTRTLVYNVGGGRVRDVGLYRAHLSAS